METLETVIRSSVLKRARCSLGRLDAAPFFVSKNSSTFQGSSTPFSIQCALISSTQRDRTDTAILLTDGTGDVSGILATDVVSVAGLIVEKQQFGAISQESPDFYGLPVSGLMGLGFKSIASSGASPFIENLVAEHYLNQNAFTFYLTRGLREGSVLTIGTIPNNHYTGEITYTPLISESYVSAAKLPSSRKEAVLSPPPKKKKI